MPLSEAELTELSASVASQDERLIAATVFSIESVLREVITLIASNPEKLQNMGGPIKAVERIQSVDVIEEDPSDMQVFNVEVSVESQNVGDREDREQSAEHSPWIDTSEVTEHGESAEVDHIDNEKSQDAVVAQLIQKRQNYNNSSLETNLFACPHCEQEFMRVFELQRHIAVKHTAEKKFQCEICGMKFALKLYLNNHIRIKHQPDKEKPYGCPQCSYRCITRSMLTRHMEKHVGDKRFKCPQCSLSFITERQLDRHSYRHQEKNLLCEYCSFKTADPIRLKSHLKIHTSTEVYKCTQCDFTTNLKSDLNKHMLSHSDETFPCTQCDLVFKKQYNLKRHMFVHQERNLLCDLCDWRTADPYEYKRHKKQHDEGKKHVCEKCGFRFIRHYDLRKHMKTHEKVFECKLCNHSFMSSHELTCHKRRRHSKLQYNQKQLDSNTEDSQSGHTLHGDEDSASMHAEESQDKATATGNQTVIIEGSGEQIILPPGVQLLNQDGTPYTGGEGTDVDQQLLEMASVIIAQVDDSVVASQVNIS